ncbi:hypothetical protein [Methylocapsa aurea]|uniref:hypothetical protein n=1 Tax=Methylocapsa aurea TaxID=663610 RepID=UPI00068EFC89|nr:hypothetical protein [Methylocapsa aurea]
MSTHIYTDLECEVIILKAVTDLIDDMVNYEIFRKFSSTSDMSLVFKTPTHQRLFNVLLIDMLSKPKNDHLGLPVFPADASGSAGTFLHYLRLIGQNPRLNVVGAALADPVEVFATWLDAECHVEKVWLGAINIETTIRVSRISFIKICGDIAKHSFPRMSVNARRIKKLLADNGHQIDIEQAYLAMPDFYQWFHTNIFAYHSSAIGEFLNNIRWGIYDYLTPEFVRSYRKTEATSLSYSFDYPNNCTSYLARAMYWELMNWSRSTPYMPRFEVMKYLKMLY